MMRWIALACVVVVVAGACTFVIEGNPGDHSIADHQAIMDRPRPTAVLLDEAKFDYGAVPQHASCQHTWRLKNNGETDLEFWLINSAHGSVLSIFRDGKSVVLKPGKVAEIELLFDSRENNGHYAKFAEIGTNDPKNPRFRLDLDVFTTPEMSKPKGGAGSRNGSSLPLAAIPFGGFGR